MQKCICYKEVHLPCIARIQLCRPDFDCTVFWGIKLYCHIKSHISGAFISGI